MRVRGRVRRSVLGMCIGAMAGASAVVSMPALGASPAGTGTTQSGWITVRDGSADGAPGAGDAGSAPAGTIGWTHQSTGVVRVSFDALGFDGVPIASALAKDGRRCVVLGWAGTPVNVTVACDDLGGIRTDTPFTLTYTNGDAADGGASGAYVHYYVGTPGADSVPSATYHHASNDGAAAVSHQGTGQYRETLAGLGDATASGTFLVTRYGGSGSCKVAAWRSTPGDLEVDVSCRDAAGALVDAPHNVLFLRGLGPEGYGGGPAAYLWADRQKQDAPYQPKLARSWQSNGKRPTIDRTAAGVYTVTFPGQSKGGTAVVTAYGTGAISCQIGSVRASAAPARVQVRCHKPDGSLADSKFTLAWTK